MTTVKLYTSLKQSRKLVEILPLKSVDMYWFEGTANIGYSKISQDYYNQVGYSYIACWSLTALLNILPRGTRLIKAATDDTYHCDCPKGNVDKWFDNPIDACYELVLKLNELNLL